MSANLLTFSKPLPLCRWYSTFFSFHPRNFDSSIAHLQTALQQISSWMSANLLTLNSSKTEFLIIGLKQQLSKIDNSSLNTTHSACNLGFILLSLIRSHHFLSHAILICDNSAVSILTSILKQPVPLLPLLSTLYIQSTSYIHNDITLSNHMNCQVSQCLHNLQCSGLPPWHRHWLTRQVSLMHNMIAKLISPFKKIEKY